jgi:hypothetical protein
MHRNPRLAWSFAASLVLVASLAQKGGAQSTGSAIRRLRVAPVVREFAVGDSLRLVVQALDSAGREVPGAIIRFVPAGGWFRGGVDSLGWVRAGAPGVIPIQVVATAGGARPLIERVEIHVVPGPAAYIEVTPPIPKLVAGQRVRLDARVTSAAGDQRTERVTWTSNTPGVARVDDGVLVGRGPGIATIRARAGAAQAAFEVTVVPNAIAAVELTPSASQVRQGDVVRFTATAKDARGRPIPGLSPAWSFSPGEGLIDDDGAFVGYRAGQYTVTASFGGQTGSVVVTVSPREARRSLSVVGRLPRNAFLSAEVWLHPNGRVAYLGTTNGGDRIYAIDVSNPAKPVIVDSIVANSRSMNDLMTTEDGKWLVFTREGAADRRNGIVIADVSDPLHPKAVADFTDGVTAGVHSAYVNTQPKFGTFVYLTNSGTGELNVIDITDARNPKRVARWSPRDNRAGRSLHDVDVRDGLAYVSYWKDGLVILDVGHGIKGGSPSNPTLVSQFKYDAEALYPDATTRYGPGFISGTHTSWRHKNYVFIADEVFPPTPGPTGWDFANVRAYGRLQVIDVSDIEKPKSVAWYEPETGGVHNVWAAGDTLYVGAYNAGFHAFDISGELRGDLKAQGREIAELLPAVPDGVVPNKAFTWGVVVNPKDGLAYVNDMFSGLWIVRIEPRRVMP